MCDMMRSSLKRPGHEARTWSWPAELGSRRLVLGPFGFDEPRPAPLALAGALSSMGAAATGTAASGSGGSTSQGRRLGRQVARGTQGGLDLGQVALGNDAVHAGAVGLRKEA